MNNTVGLGLRRSFHEQVLKSKPDVPWFEVITENYLFFDGYPRQFLHKIRESYPLVLHGVSLSIGSLEPPRKDYLLQLKKLNQYCLFDNYKDALDYKEIYLSKKWAEENWYENDNDKEGDIKIILVRPA